MAGARVVYYARKRYVHVAKTFPLARYYMHLIRLSSFKPMGKRTNQLRGWWCVLKLPKPVSLTYDLRVGWANRMILGSSDCSGNICAGTRS